MPNPKIEVLFEDASLLVVNKPAGWQTVDEQGRECLRAELTGQFGTDLHAVHRLDRDTSGVLAYAKTVAARAHLEDQFRARKTAKQYLALCQGIPLNPTGTIRRNLSKWQGGRRPVQVVKGSGGLKAETEYAVIASNERIRDLPGGVSLICFCPHQGRTHQIRVHAAAFQRPILGDDNYGDRAANKWLREQTGLARQALHAWMLELTHPETGKSVQLCAPIPNDMKTALVTFLPEYEFSLGKKGEI